MLWLWNVLKWTPTMAAILLQIMPLGFSGDLTMTTSPLKPRETVWCYFLSIDGGQRFCHWTYENDAKELKSRPKLAFFLIRNSKGDNIKIKRKVSPFFLPLPIYLPFITILSLFFARLRWNKGDRGQILQHHCPKSRHVLAQNSQKWSGNGDNIKIKRRVSPFLLPLLFIFLSLPFFLYFLLIYMAWRLAKSWVKSRWNKGDGAKFFSTIFINPDIYAFRQVTFGIQKLKK